MKELLGWTLLIGIALAVVITPLWMFVAACEWYSCSAQAHVMKLDYHYGSVSGCMVRLDGQMVPVDQYLNIRNIKSGTSP